MPDKSRLNFQPITGFKKVIKCAGCGTRMEPKGYERLCTKCKKKYYD